MAKHEQAAGAPAEDGKVAAKATGKSWTHAGREVTAGEVVRVSPSVLAMLVSVGVAEAV